MKRLASGINDLLGLFYPSLCITCGGRLMTREKFLCVNCWSDIPVTNFHTSMENKVAQLFWGRTQIENATAFFSYKKGSKYQQLIHFIKYRGLKELGYETGRRFGAVLANSENYKKADVIIPVPLHPAKQKKRGYNQSEWIARGISDTLGKLYSNVHLRRIIHTSTQTKKNRFERWKNVESIFEVIKPEDLTGKHILLVDDIVTTGSTLEACAHELLKISGVKVSIATLGFADF